MLSRSSIVNSTLSGSCAFLVVAGRADASGQLYAVQAGDTLSRIGQLWGVDARHIAIANRLADPNVLYIGQELCIPPW
jgi:LysM repeat protein